MANYNADIRVGITGKTQLDALERQLGRINKDLNKINKNLKAQTLTINTKGANRALDQLGRKINKLNRSIKVNATINERRTRKEGGTTVIGGGGGAAATTASAVGVALNEQIKTTRKLQKAEIDRLETNEALANQLNKITAKREQEAKILEKIERVQKGARVNKQGEDFNRVAGGLGLGNKTEPALKELNKQLRNTRLGIDNLQARVPKLSREFTQASRNVRDNSRALDENNRKVRENAKAQEKATAAIAKRKKFTKGLGTGAGLAASSGLSGIPVLGDAATGGLVAGLSGGSIAGGAAGGALAGAAVALAEFGAQAVKTATQVSKLRLSLELAAGTDFERSLETINTVVEDLNTPIEDATTNFTKLYASAQGSGIAFNDLSELFINLSAANKAFAGDAEDLNGILRAFTQIISKGTVQSEELKGQVGERLPGAFALAAQSLGMTTAQLQKALENGEVKSKEFVEKFGRYMRKFRTDADVIADAPEEAGARLTVALQNLQVDTGKELARLGAQFQNFATQAIKELTRLYNFLGQLGDEVENRINRLGGNPTNDLEGYIQGLNNANDAIREIQERSLDPTRTNEAAKEDEANLKIWYQSRKDFQAKIDKLKLGPPVPSTPPPNVVEETEEKGGNTKGYESQAAALLTQQRYLEGILRLEKERFTGSERLRADQEYLTSQIEIELGYIRDLEDLERQKLDAKDMEISKENLLLEKKIALAELDREELQRQYDLNKAFTSTLADLEDTLKIETAITEEAKRKVQYEAALRKIREDGSLSDDEKKKLLNVQNKINEAREGNQGLSGYMKQLQRELLDTEAMIVSLAQTVETELASAMSTAIVGLIDGTTTAEEAFATMFKNIGQAFIDMATQMIAKALVMKALGILFPGSSNTGAYGTGVEAPLTGGLDFSSAFTRASGGPVAQNTPYLVGERGPELFVPSSGGRVVNNADSRSALDRYTPNSSYNYSSSLSVTTGPVMQMDNDQYIRREDFERGLRQASEDGAKRGEAMTLRRLKNSRSTRSTLGM